MNNCNGNRTLCHFMDDVLSRVDLSPASRKSRELFRPEKPVVKLQSACFEKLIF